MVWDDPILQMRFTPGWVYDPALNVICSTFNGTPNPLAGGVFMGVELPLLLSGLLIGAKGSVI